MPTPWLKYNLKQWIYFFCICFLIHLKHGVISVHIIWFRMKNSFQRHSWIIVPWNLVFCSLNQNANISRKMSQVKFRIFVEIKSINICLHTNISVSFHEHGIFCLFIHKHFICLYYFENITQTLNKHKT